MPPSTSVKRVVPYQKCPACTSILHYARFGTFPASPEDTAAAMVREGCCGAHLKLLGLRTEEREELDRIDREWRDLYSN